MGIGIITALVMFVMNFIWHMAEDNILAKPPMGTIIVNALVAILLSAFLAHLAWYGVVQKHGCCCFVLCCCLGQPNLLVTAILSVVSGILAVISVIDAVSFFYVGFEAFMIWRLCSSNGGASSGKGSAATTAKQQNWLPPTSEVTVVGAAQAVSKPVADDIEAAETKTEA